MTTPFQVLPERIYAGPGWVVPLVSGERGQGTGIREQGTVFSVRHGILALLVEVLILEILFPCLRSETWVTRVCGSREERVLWEGEADSFASLRNDSQKSGQQQEQEQQQQKKQQKKQISPLR